MKFTKLMMLSAALGLSGLAQASAVMDNDFIGNNNKPVTLVNTAKGELGMFKIESKLRGVPTSIAATDSVVATKGSMSIVKAADDAAPELVGKGTIVRHLLTNDLTTLTGNVTVLLGKNAIAEDLATSVGMELVTVFPGTDIAILKVNQGSDLLQAFNQLKQSELVLESKVEVTDTIYTNQ